MDKKRLHPLLKLILLFQFLFAEVAFANNLPFHFENSRRIVLRNSNLRAPVLIENGAKISIDSQYLLRTLGTETPTQEQMQRLLLNPGEASNGRIVTESFLNEYTNRRANEYFFPVTITTKSGEVRTGKVALNAYVRMGSVELKRDDGADPKRFQSQRTTEQLQGLVEINRPTEGQPCDTCATAVPPIDTRPLSEVARSIESSYTSSTNELWNKYITYAREFTAANPNITRARAGYFKRLFIQGLVERYGAAEAGRILAPLTGFAEAPHRSDVETQVAEVAAVIRVMDNRAAVNFRSRSRTLRDIGVSESESPLLTNILADWQFSAWNERDNSLLRMINFNPDTADLSTKRKMMLAFEAQRMMTAGEVQFIGRMNDSRMYHYHANYVNPSWDRASARVAAASVRVNGETIDITRQRGARHIFYVGIN
jgi:hypothetical protein